MTSLSDDNEAERRYKEYKSKDPFPEIPPALLNSADIEDYVTITGMISPFYTEPKENYFKSASYGIMAKGSFIYWLENGEKCEKILDDKNELILEKNSIVYVFLEPMFRIPDYIAIRFNLSIGYIHKGLLLGTGPLVDPGFKGKLLIPLHNLTNNLYTIRSKDILIWIEFTKVSNNTLWNSFKDQTDAEKQGKPNRIGKYIPFPENKNITSPNDYLYKANSGRPILSSIPSLFQKATNSAEKALKRINSLTYANIIGLFIAILGSFFTIIYPTWQLVRETIKDEQKQLTTIEFLEKEVQSLKEELKNLSKRLINNTQKSESQSKSLVPQDAKSDK